MALTQAQIDALNGVTSMTPNQSAATLGNATKSMLDWLPTAGAVVGGIGGAALGGVVGAPSGPGAGFTAYAGGVTGAGLGGAGGEALKEKIEGSPLNPANIIQQGGVNAALDAVGGPFFNVAGKALGKVANPVISALGRGAEKVSDFFGGGGGVQAAKAVSETVRPPVNVATKRLSATAETMTKAEREAAIKDGRMTPSGKFVASKTEQRAGEIMQGKTYSNPVKTTKAVQDEISTRGKEAETYLETNNKPISNKEDANAFQTKKQESQLFMTKSEAAAYDEQVGVFQQVLKKYGGYNTANYYKALKEYETNVTANLPKGKDALLQPGGAARIQAAKDVRGVVRDMIGEKNPEFKGKMFDLASLYDSLDNVVANAEKGGHSLAKRYPKTVGAIGLGAGVVGVEAVKDEVKSLLGF